MMLTMSLYYDLELIVENTEKKTFLKSTRRRYPWIYIWKRLLQT